MMDYAYQPLDLGGTKKSSIYFQRKQNDPSDGDFYWEHTDSPMDGMGCSPKNQTNQTKPVGSEKTNLS